MALLSILWTEKTTAVDVELEAKPERSRRKILVTGAAGFVGSHVADYLLQRGDDVIVVDEVNDYYDTRIKEANLDLLASKNAKIYRGDICNGTLMAAIFQKEQPDVVCHMAARAGVRPSIEDPFIYIHSNIKGTTQLMELSRRHNITNFVFASSSSVYGGSKSTFFDENEPVDHPISPYAASKKACELFSYTWHHLYGLNITALRFFTVYGPRGRPDMAPFKFIDMVSKGETLQQFGDGTSSRDYTFIDDIREGVVRAIDQPHGYEIFNLGKGSGTSLSEFVQLVQKYVNRTAKIEVLPDQPGDVPYTCANVSKAQTLLGYAPSLPFEEGIQKTVEWYESVYGSQQQNSTTTRRTRRRRLASTETDNKDGMLPWENVRVVQPHVEKKKVLVTGGGGFIGSHVADALLSRGDDVVILDEMNSYYNVSIKEGNLKILQEKYGKDRLTIYRGDICNETLVTYIFESEKPKWICHMAARAGVRPSINDPFVYIHSNIEGTTRLLELSRQHGVINFVLASSSSVYGGSSSAYFSEEERVDYPISPYAASKKACELFAYTYHHLYNLNVTALRFFTVYGPRGRPDMAPFIFIDRISRGQEIQQFGDGTSSRDYTYVDDIVSGVVRALDRPYPYQIFNLGKGSGTRLIDFITMVEKYVGKKANITKLPMQPGDVPYTCADVRKAEKLLGYKASIPFEEGIKRTVEWYKEHFFSPVRDPVATHTKDSTSSIEMGSGGSANISRMPAVSHESVEIATPSNPVPVSPIASRPSLVGSGTAISTNSTTKSSFQGYLLSGKNESFGYREYSSLFLVQYVILGGLVVWRVSHHIRQCYHHPRHR